MIPVPGITPTDFLSTQLVHVMKGRIAVNKVPVNDAMQNLKM